jgi:hypothetical protein
MNLSATQLAPTTHGTIPYKRCEHILTLVVTQAPYDGIQLVAVVLKSTLIVFVSRDVGLQKIVANVLRVGRLQFASSKFFYPEEPIATKEMIAFCEFVTQVFEKVRFARIVRPRQHG